MSEQAVWIEWTVDSEGRRKVDLDDAHSAIGSGAFKFGGEFDPNAGEVFLNFPQNAGALGDVLILPSTLLSLIVRGDAWECLRELVKGHFHARRVKVVTRDRMIAEFMAVKPADTVDCVDTKRSEGIEWLIPGRFTNCWKRLRFYDNCLGNLPWARVDKIDRLAVNDEIMRRLTGIDPKGIHFVAPEELPPMRRPRK